MSHQQDTEALPDIAALTRWSLEDADPFEDMRQAALGYYHPERVILGRGDYARLAPIVEAAISRPQGQCPIP